MKFEKKEELEFQVYRFKNSLSIIRTGILFGLILYCLFGFLDSLNFPDSKKMVFLIRYILIFPLFILLYISTYYKIFRKIMNIVLSLAVIIPSFGIILMMMISKSGELGYHLYYAGIMVIIILACTFFKLKLWNFILSCFIILFTYGFMAIYFQNCLQGGFKGKNFTFLLSNILFLFSIMIISSVITLMFELNLRKEFVHKKIIKEEKEKLRESEERNRILLENMSEGVTILDFDENFNFANPAAEILFGVESGKLVGKNVRDFLSEKNAQKIQKEAKILKRKIHSTFDLEIIRPDKEIHSVLVTATPYYDNLDRVEGALCIFRDITKRKKAEVALKINQESFNNIVDKNASGIIIIDHEGIVRFVNPSAEALFDRKHEELVGELLGFPMITDEVTEIDIIRKGGEIGTGEMFAIESEWEGKFAHLTMINDITERKKAENEIQKHQDRIALFKDLLAHDINNLNHGILSYLNMILSTPEVPGVYNNKIKICLNLSEEISKLIMNVQTLSELEEEDTRLEKVDFMKVLFQNIEKVKLSYSEKKIIFKYDFSNNKVFIKGNELLGTAIFNIISNAVKYHHHETAEIEINHLLSDDKKTWRIEFKDNGPGIIDSEKNIIFNRMQRASADKKIYGLGLGLTLVKNIVAKFDGKIWVEDRIDGDHTQGANFIMLLKNV